MMKNVNAAEIKNVIDDPMYDLKHKLNIAHDATELIEVMLYESDGVDNRDHIIAVTSMLLLHITDMQKTLEISTDRLMTIVKKLEGGEKK